jgi:hypothetical protein
MIDNGVIMAQILANKRRMAALQRVMEEIHADPDIGAMGNQVAAHWARMRNVFGELQHVINAATPAGKEYDGRTSQNAGI